ncbi:MAG: helix-turn-helix transcriptional regulator [Actinobacteria bacterium]|nr:helix-turn-helix transcriptional regulator [Actinomycetota bacterium]
MTAGRQQPLDELFGVLADPTRRRLLERLVHEGPHTATELAADETVTRQAVVKHLQALGEAQLVTSERTGREVRYRATTERLADAVAWLVENSAKWDRRLDRLRDRANRPAVRR